MNVIDEVFSDRTINFILKVNKESWETMAGLLMTTPTMKERSFSQMYFLTNFDLQTPQKQNFIGHVALSL